MEIEREVVVTREVQIPVTVEVQKHIVVDREVPVTVEVERTVEVTREVPVTVVVEKEVEIIRNTFGDVSMAILNDAFDVLDADDGDNNLSWYEACAGLGTDLDLMSNIWLILIRHGWQFSDNQASIDADLETHYWTNEELCERWDWQEY